MRKLILIALKDLRLIFRDRAALVLMLLAPFLLTLGMGLLTGRFSPSSNTGINDIPVAIVNQDEGELGKALVQMFQSNDLADLVEPALLSQPADAKARVDEDKFAAAILIPPGFSASIIPAAGQNTTHPAVQIEFYSNPTQPTNAGILRTILEQFISQVEIGRISGEVIISQLITSGAIDPGQAAALGAQVGSNLASASTDSSPITLKQVTSSGEAVKFDIMAYMAPGMALMFLMFTVTYGARSLMVEERAGTLPRMLVSPTTSAQILAGKVTGVFLTAVAQLLILIGASSLLFQLQWGNPLGVLLLVMGASAGATGWGMLIASLLKTPGQIASMGSAVMLIFGILGGSFFDISMLPGWVSILSKITPNAWGIQGFTTLAAGAGLRQITTPLLALFGMGILLFVIAVILIQRRGLDRR